MLSVFTKKKENSMNKEGKQGVKQKVQVNKSRDLAIDALKIMAAYGVIFNHSNERGFWLYTVCVPGSPAYWVYLLLSVLCKTVPLFLMISGALMLTKDREPVGTLWKKRVLRMSAALAVVSLLYYIEYLYRNGGTFHLREFLRMVYSGGVKGHLWYLYAYIAFLICLPFLQSMAAGLDNRQFCYMIGIALVYDGIMPIFEHFFMGDASISSWLRPSWLLSFTVLYPCVGYFLYNRIVRAGKIRGYLAVAWLFTLSGIAVTCLMTFVTGNPGEKYFLCFSVLYCGTLFLTAEYMFRRIHFPDKAVKLINSVGNCTFGVYLLHYLFLDSKYFDVLNDKLIAGGMNRMLADLIVCGLVMIVCLVITYGIKSVPGLRRLI